MAFDVAITGMGALTPLGVGVDAMWRGLLAGESGVGRISIFDPSGFPCQIAGEVTDFDPAAAIGDRLARRTDRFVQFSIIAVKQALVDAGLDITDELRDRVGIYIGSGIGGITTPVRANGHSQGPGTQACIAVSDTDDYSKHGVRPGRD